MSLSLSLYGPLESSAGPVRTPRLTALKGAFDFADAAGNSGTAPDTYIAAPGHPDETRAPRDCDASLDARRCRWGAGGLDQAQIMKQFRTIEVLSIQV